MNNQVNTDITWADSGSNSVMNAARINAAMNDITLLNGAVINQVERTLPNGADTVLVGDSTAQDTGAPIKVKFSNLLLESQRNGSQQFVASDTGSAGTYQVALNPAATAYVVGMVVRFKAGTANTGISTLNVNSLGPIALKKNATFDLMAGDIRAGEIITAIYDGNNFQLVAHPRSWDCVSAAKALPGVSSVVSVSHGLGVVPTKMSVMLLCVTADKGYTAGMMLPASPTNLQVYADNNNVYVSQFNLGLPSLIPAGGGTMVTVTSGCWNIIIYASI